MANQFSSAGTITQDMVDLLDKSIDEIWNRRDEHAGVLARFFDVENKSEGLSHIITNVGSELSLPQISQDTEALPYLVPADGFKQTFNLINYRSGIRVTDTVMRADRFDKILFMASGQIKSGMRKDEYMRAAIFNDAFSGTAGADSLPLCDNSHPQENPEQGTWDNLSTGALTTANLHALRLLARKMTNSQGDPDPAMPQTLLIPPDLEREARELVTSTLDAETNLNTRTVLIGDLELVVSPFLTDTDAYFLLADRQGQNKGLHEVRLMDWEIGNNSPANVDIKIDKRIKSIKAYGFTTSKNVYGSAGV